MRQFTRNKHLLPLVCCLRVLAVFSVEWESYLLGERGRGDTEGLNSASQYHLPWPISCKWCRFDGQTISWGCHAWILFWRWRVNTSLGGNMCVQTMAAVTNRAAHTHKSTLDSTEQSSGLHGVLGIWALSGSASGPFPPLWHSASLFLNWRFHHELHSVGSGNLPSLEMLKGYKTYSPNRIEINCGFGNFAT